MLKKVKLENKKILDSWKEISEYLGRDTRTCFRWEKELGLPVHRIDETSSRSKVFAYKSEIDEWLKEKANNKELQKKTFLENKRLIVGLLSSFIILTAIFSFLYFAQIRPFGPSTEIPSIAVLPFENLNSSEYDYFSEGIANEIINNLTRLKELKVMPALLVSRYKSSSRNVKQIGKELGVEYILKGNIKKNDDKISLFVQLIRTKDDTNIWSAEFEEELENIFSIQNSICLKISEILNINMAQSLPFPLDDGKTHDYLAFDNYLKGSYISNRFSGEKSDPWKLYHNGKYYWGKCNTDSNEFAINLFNQAIKIDRNFAPAYIGLASCYAHYVNFNWDFDVEWLNKAEDLARKAQSIDPDLPEYYSTLIEIYLLKEIGFNVNTKKIAFELAKEGIKKYPNHPQLNSIVGYCYTLKFGEEGKEVDFDKALEYKEKSFLLNPFAISNIVYSELLMLRKKFHKAIEVCNIIKKYDSSLITNFRLGEIYYYLGDLDKSKAIFKQFETPLKFKIGSLFYLGMIASQKREKKEAQRIVQKINTISPQEFKVFKNHIKLASIYMGLEEKELGYRHLNSFFDKAKTKKMRYFYYKYIDIDKNFDKLKKEEKFKEIIKK